MEFERKSVFQDKGAHYPLRKTTISQEDITILILFTPKNTTAKYIKSRLMDSPCETGKSAITMGNFNTSINN